MKTVDSFNDYKVLDMSNGEKLESWAGITLRRPDPQIIWTSSYKHKLWNKADAHYIRSDKGGGMWKINNKSIPESWQFKYKDLTFNIKLMGFKNTGLFPEQAYNWEYIIDTIKGKENINVLNLFAYTGAASVAALYAGASVTHVDSSKGMVAWAKENVSASGLADRHIRYMVDDVVKFVKREIRRGVKYDAIIMDPPTFGKGTSGEIWKIERSLYELLMLCNELLTDEPLFVLINSYTTGLPKTALENCLYETINTYKKGVITSDELGIKAESGLVLPCGVYARWEYKK